MFCPKCGSQNDDNNFKCVKCGFILHVSPASGTAKKTSVGWIIAIIVGAVMIPVLILAAIAIPAYIGALEKSKKSAIQKTVATERATISYWMTAAKKASTSQGSATEVDTDGNGSVVIGTDMTNDALAATGVINQWLIAAAARGQSSPWNNGLPLYVNGGMVATSAACDSISTANPGQITLCFTPNQNAEIERVFIYARDTAVPSNVINQYTISSDEY